jgi:hypothetical protein
MRDDGPMSGPAPFQNVGMPHSRARAPRRGPTTSSRRRGSTPIRGGGGPSLIDDPHQPARSRLTQVMESPELPPVYRPEPFGTCSGSFVRVLWVLFGSDRVATQRTSLNSRERHGQTPEQRPQRPGLPRFPRGDPHHHFPVLRACEDVSVRALRSPLRRSSAREAVNAACAQPLQTECPSVRGAPGVECPAPGVPTPLTPESLPAPRLPPHDLDSPHA